MFFLMKFKFCISPPPSTFGCFLNIKDIISLEEGHENGFGIYVVNTYINKI